MARRAGFDAVMGLMEHLGFRPAAPRGPTCGARPGFASPAQVQLVRALRDEWTEGRGDERGPSGWLERSFRVSDLRALATEGARGAITASKTMKARPGPPARGPRPATGGPGGAGARRPASLGAPLEHGPRSAVMGPGATSVPGGRFRRHRPVRGVFTEAAGGRPSEPRPAGGAHGARSAPSEGATRRRAPEPGTRHARPRGSTAPRPEGSALGRPAGGDVAALMLRAFGPGRTIGPAGPFRGARGLVPADGRRVRRRRGAPLRRARRDRQGLAAHPAPPRPAARGPDP